VLAAPASADPYYRPVRRDILDFQIAYARQILGRDNVVILCDRRTLRELARSSPDDILLEAPMRDIWTRDFLPVRARGSRALPLCRRRPVRQAGRCRLGPGRLPALRQTPRPRLPARTVDPRRRQCRRQRCRQGHRDGPVSGRQRTRARRSHHPPSRTTRRGTRRHPPADPEDALGHADGMAAFIASNTVALPRGRRIHEAILRELRDPPFPASGSSRSKRTFDDDAFDPRYGSARGIHVNATVTDRFCICPSSAWPPTPPRWRRSSRPATAKWCRGGLEGGADGRQRPLPRRPDERRKRPPPRRSRAPLTSAAPPARRERAVFDFL
jgi:hypothetical protein